MDRKGKSHIYNWLTNKYQLIIRNEADFSEKTTISYNYGKAMMFFFFIFAISAVVGYFTISYVDSLFSNEKTDRELGQKIVDMRDELDSLNTLVKSYESQDKALRELMGVLEMPKEDSLK